MPTVRVSPSTHFILKQLAEREGASHQDILDRAVERYRRERFLREANAAYARFRADDRAWREELAEREAWDATVADGLDER